MHGLHQPAYDDLDPANPPGGDYEPELPPVTDIDTGKQSQWPRDLRLQDIVAKTARLNLRDTVKVIRAIQVVYEHIDGDMAERLRIDLESSIHNGSYNAPLHSKPERPAITACQAFFDSAMATDPDFAHEYDSIFDLELDKFYRRKMRHM